MKFYLDNSLLIKDLKLSLDIRFLLIISNQSILNWMSVWSTISVAPSHGGVLTGIEVLTNSSALLLSLSD